MVSREPGPAMTPFRLSSRASSHSSNTWAWSSVAGKSVRTNPASGLRAKNQRRSSASRFASSAAAETGRREISGPFRRVGETCSIFKERTWIISFSGGKSGEPRRRSFALAGGPQRDKRSEMPAIATGVKNLFHEGLVGPDCRAQQQQAEHRQRDFHHRLVAQGLAGHTLLRVGAAGPDAALFQEAVIVALQQEGLDL